MVFVNPDFIRQLPVKYNAEYRMAPLLLNNKNSLS